MPVGDACTGSETPLTCTWDSAFCQPSFYGDPLAMVWSKSAGTVTDIGWLAQGIYSPDFGFDLTQVHLNNWSNVGDAADEDGSFASASMIPEFAGGAIGKAYSTWLVASDLRLAVPDGATIVGMRVAMKAKSDTVFTTSPPYCVPVYWADALLAVGGNYYLQKGDFREPFMDDGSTYFADINPALAAYFQCFGPDTNWCDAGHPSGPCEGDLGITESEPYINFTCFNSFENDPSPTPSDQRYNPCRQKWRSALSGVLPGFDDPPLTPANVNDPSFGVGVLAYAQSAEGDPITAAYADCLGVAVYYTPGSPASPTTQMVFAVSK